MQKTIIFCADGTWNGPGSDDFTDKNAAWTNVFKLFNNLAGENAIGDSRLADEQERVLTAANGDVSQIAKYLHGVGDSDNFLVRILGGTTGAGIIARIVRGYTFVSRNYVAGDKIILLGFSRGAYTARALGGLIATRGLLDPAHTHDKADAYRLGSAVWSDYRRTALAAKGSSLLHEFQRTIRDLPGFFSSKPAVTMVENVPIEAIAVWDTVGALGIPIYVEKDVRADLFRFADTVLSPKVLHGFHAIAADEQRDDFVPTFWDPDGRIVQCLFPGAHADVGGGYRGDESGLSDAALLWMMNRLATVGVVFAEKPGFPPQPNAAGVSHRPWGDLPFSRLPHSMRQFLASGKLGISQCLLDRLTGDATYAPANLAAYLNGRIAGANVTVMPL